MTLKQPPTQTNLEYIIIFKTTAELKWMRQNRLDYLDLQRNYWLNVVKNTIPTDDNKKALRRNIPNAGLKAWAGTLKFFFSLINVLKLTWIK